jgi:hypothetical protein
MIPECLSPVPLAALVEYWLGELDSARETDIDEHLFGCGHCSAALQSLVDLGDATRALVRAGAVRAVVTDAFVQRLAAAGVKLREYRVAQNGSVNCTVAPQDEVMIARLQAPLAGIERLDMDLLGFEDKVRERLTDIPFDPAIGEVIFTPQIAGIRALPASTSRVRLLAVAAGGERLVGEYTFNHTPWPGAR